MALIATGEAFKDTRKNKIYLWLYEFFMGLGQWFITHCDMEPLDLWEAQGWSSPEVTSYSGQFGEPVTWKFEETKKHAED